MTAAAGSTMQAGHLRRQAATQPRTQTEVGPERPPRGGPVHCRVRGLRLDRSSSTPPSSWPRPAVEGRFHRSELLDPGARLPREWVETGCAGGPLRSVHDAGADHPLPASRCNPNRGQPDRADSKPHAEPDSSETVTVTVTGIPLSTAFPEGTSVTESSMTEFRLTPACSLATRRRVPSTA